MNLLPVVHLLTETSIVLSSTRREDEELYIATNAIDLDSLMTNGNVIVDRSRFVCDFIQRPIMLHLIALHRRSGKSIDADFVEKLLGRRFDGSSKDRNDLTYLEEFEETGFDKLEALSDEGQFNNISLIKCQTLLQSHSTKRIIYLKDRLKFYLP